MAPTHDHPTELDRVMADQGRMSSWLARVTDVSASTVSRWRQGMFMPEADKQAIIAAALGRSVDGLFFSPEHPVTTGQITREPAGA